MAVKTVSKKTVMLYNGTKALLPPLLTDPRAYPRNRKTVMLDLASACGASSQGPEAKSKHLYRFVAKVTVMLSAAERSRSISLVW